MISILLPNLRGGGAERVNIDLAYEFATAGHDVEFVLMEACGELLEEVRALFPIVDLATPRVRSVPSVLASYLRSRRPEVLMAAMWPLTVIAPFAVGMSGRKCKLLVSEHNSLSVQYCERGRLHNWLMRFSMAVGYRLADSRVAVSSGVAEDVAVLSGLDSAAFDVIHNPVPSPRMPSQAELDKAESLWSAPAGGRIVTVGSMKAQKNHPLLLRAFASLNQAGAKLMFVGEGSGRDELVSLAQELGVSDRVIFAGFHSDPTPFYLSADLFVLPSNYEGFGNVIVEAMACGTPVVSTDCPSGPSEILAGGKYGRLVPVGDAGAMTDAIEAALHEPVPTELLKARASEFHPAKAAAAYLNLLGMS